MTLPIVQQPDGPAEVTLPLGYVEMPHQTELHDGCDSHRNACIICHRRAGKTVAMVAQLIRDVLRCKLKYPVGAFVAPTKVLARKVSWPYFEQMLGGVPGVKLRAHQLMIEIEVGDDLGPRRIYLEGAEQPDRLRGIYLDACVVDEMADCPSSLITSVLRPALADRKGKLYLIGTVKGRNEFWRMYERGQELEHWFTANFLPEYTQMIDPEELELIRSEISEDEFLREFRNDPTAAVQGAYYGRTFAALEEAGQLTRVPHDPGLEVVAAMDLGWSDSTAVWFVQLHRGGEGRVIDYVEFTNTPFWKVLEECAQRHPVKRWIGPHDLEVHEYSTGQKRIDFAKDHGVRFEVAPNIPVIDGIEAVRQALPRFWFDAEKCKDGIDALRLYRSKWDDKKNVLSRNPEHDWTSHGADAFRYLVLATNGGYAARARKQLDFTTLDDDEWSRRQSSRVGSRRR